MAWLFTACDTLKACCTGNAGRALTIVEDGDRALVKDIVKRLGVRLLERAPPGPAVAAWAAKTERYEEQLQAILQVSGLADAPA